jgi:hypothetical protein
MAVCIASRPGLIPAASAAKLVKRLFLALFEILAKSDKIEE